MMFKMICPPQPKYQQWDPLIVCLSMDHRAVLTSKNATDLSAQSLSIIDKSLTRKRGAYTGQSGREGYPWWLVVRTVLTERRSPSMDLLAGCFFFADMAIDHLLDGSSSYK